MTADRVPTYQAHIDWYGHGLLDMGLSGWTAAGSAAPALSETTEQAYSGSESLACTWAGSDDESRAERAFSGIAQSDWTAAVWLYVHPDSGDVAVDLREAAGVENSPVTVTEKGSWQLVTFSQAASEDDWRLVVYPTGTGGSGDVVYIGWSRVASAEDDVSCHVLMERTPLDAVYGRDEARDLSAIRTGEMSLELLNTDFRYTPNNADSPIVGGVRENRRVLVTCEFGDRMYTVFSGYTEDYRVRAGLNSQSVEIPCVDLLGRLRGVRISTDLYPSIRTGDAVKVVLEAVGLPVDDRLIDSGATTLRGWYVADGDALQALSDIVAAEGPPSLYTVGTGGCLIFRDRLHRLRDSYPQSAVAELTADIEPGRYAIRDDSDVDYGWSETANTVNVRYSLKDLSGEYTTVWSQEGTVSWGPDSTEGTDLYEFRGVASTAYYDAQNPVGGQLVVIENNGPEETNVTAGVEPADYDYVLLEGEVELVSMTRSGTQVSVVMRDLSGSVSTVQNMSIRAKAVISDELTVTRQDAEALGRQGIEKPLDVDLGSATAADAEAIADLVLSRRSRPRPIVTAVVPNRDGEYTDMQLSRDLSDPVRVNVPQWMLDEDFAVEGIRHEPDELGHNHVTTLYMEQVDPDGSGRQPALYLSGLGAYARAPMTPLMQATGDLDLRAELELDNWADGTQRGIVGRWVLDGDQRSYLMTLQPTGHLRLYWSPDGTTVRDPVSTVPVPITSGRLAVSATLFADNTSGGHTVRFWIADSIDGDWTMLGSGITTAGVTSVYPGTADMEVGSWSYGASGPLNGIVHAVHVESDFNGTVAADPRFDQQDKGVTAFTDSIGNEWTLQGSAAIANKRPTFILGKSRLNTLDSLAY